MTAPGDDEQPTVGGAVPKVPVGNGDKVRGRVFVGPVDEPDAYELLHPDRSVGGGEGTVWQAAYRGRFDRQLLYAVKRLDRPDGADMSWPDEKVRRLWDDQLRLLERVTHPHLVKYHRIFLGWDVHGGGTRTGFPDPGKTCYFLLMDWVDGRSLAARIKTGDGNLAARVGWIAEIAAAIDHLHSGDQTGGIALFHHDVKPANIIINELNGAILVDCGLLRYDGDNSPTVQMFTPEYCDPWTRDNPRMMGAGSDLYALAATAYHAITGEKPQPHDPKTMADRITAATNRPATDQKLLAAHMLTVLGNPPPARPASASAWAATLQQIAVGDVAQPGSRSPQHSIVLKIAAIALVLSTIVGIAFVVIHANRTPQTVLSTDTGLGRGGAGGTTQAGTTSGSTPTTLEQSSTSGASSVPAGPPQPAEATKWLEGLSPTDSSEKPLTGVFAAGGKDVVQGVALQPVSGRDAQVSYDIGGQYATFEFDLVIGDGGTPVDVRFNVLGDGTPLLDAAGGLDVALDAVPVSESIKVAGVRTLTLVTTVPRGVSLPPQAIFASARLVPSGGSPVPTTAPPSAPAAETKWLDLSIPKVSEPLLKGVFAAGGKDVVHGVGLQPVSGRVGQVSYDINGQYAMFEFDLVIGDGGTPGAVHFDVLGDGTPLPDAGDGFDVASTAPAVSESIRVAGVQTLTLVATVPRGVSLPPQAIFANARLVP